MNALTAFIWSPCLPAPKRSDIMTNSIKKGKRAELECVHTLEKLTGATWHRVPCSGATATGQGVTDDKFKGDCFSDDPKYANYCIESKIIKGAITLEALLSPVGIFREWWKQASEESGSKVPILIFKYKYSPMFVACWETYLKDNCNRIIVPIGERSICITTIENLKLGVNKDV